MSVVLDTTVLVDVLRGCQAAKGFLKSLEGQPSCSEVTRAEMIRGLRSAERASADRLLFEIRWCLPLATSNVKHFPMFPRLKPPY